MCWRPAWKRRPSDDQYHSARIPGGKLYRRRLFDTVRYPKGKTSEDAYVIMDILEQINRAVFTPKTEYY